MELKDFISTSLKEIVDGISEAQEYAKKKGAIINPSHYSVDLNKAYTDLHNINFSILVSSGDQNNAEGGAGIFVGPVTLGGKVGSSEANQATNRIEFDIPIKYPKND